MNYREAKSKKPKIKRINHIDGEIFIYNNLEEVEKEGFSRDKVLRCIRGRNKTYNGYIWKLEV